MKNDQKMGDPVPSTIEELEKLSTESCDIKNPRSTAGCCQDCACEDRTCN